MARAARRRGALLLRRTPMLNCSEGFRLTVFGLVLLGVPAFYVWRARAAGRGDEGGYE